MNRNTLRLGAVALALGLFACDDSTTPPYADGGSDGSTDAVKSDGQSGDGQGGAKTRDYVIKTMAVPKDQAEIDKYGHDYNNDSKVDNQLGGILMAIAGAIPGMDIGASMNQNILNGTVIALMQVKSSDFANDASASLQGWTGETTTCCATKPCSDADAKKTCFSGTHSFKVDKTSPTSAVLGGKITSSKLTVGPGEIEVLLPIGFFPAKVMLKQARIEATINAAGLIEGKISGVVTKADIDGKIVPSVAKVLNGELNEPTTQQTVKDAIKKIFDTNSDGTIDNNEVSENGLIKLLLAGDVDIDNDKVMELSAGVGFTAVPCAIATQ